MNYERTLAWSTLVSFLGLPADPRWGGWVLDWLDRENKIQPIEGIGCDSVVITATRQELLDAVAEGLREEDCASRARTAQFYGRVFV